MTEKLEEIISDPYVEQLLRNLSTPQQNWSSLISEIDQKYKSSKVHLFKQVLINAATRALSLETTGDIKVASSPSTNITFDENSLKKVLSLLPPKEAKSSHGGQELAHSVAVLVELMQSKFGLEGDSELFAFLAQLMKKFSKQSNQAEEKKSSVVPSSFSQEELIGFLQFVLSEDSVVWFLLLFRVLLEIFQDPKLLKISGGSVTELPQILPELEKSRMFDEQDIQDLTNMLKQKEHRKSFESLPRILIVAGSASKCIKYEVTGKSTAIATGYQISSKSTRKFSYYELSFKEKDAKLKGFKFGWTSLASVSNLNESNLGDLDTSYVYDVETGIFMNSYSRKTKRETKGRSSTHNADTMSAKQSFSEQLAKSLSAKSFDLDDNDENQVQLPEEKEEENLFANLFADDEEAEAEENAEEAVDSAAQSKDTKGTKSTETGAALFPDKFDRSNDSILGMESSDSFVKSTDTIQSAKDSKQLEPDVPSHLLDSTLSRSEILNFSTFGCVLVHETGRLLFYGDGRLIGISPINIDFTKCRLETLVPVFSIGGGCKADINVGTVPFRFGYAVAQDVYPRITSQEQTISEKAAHEAVSVSQIKSNFTNYYASFEERLKRPEGEAKGDIESACILVQNVYSDALKIFTFEFSAKMRHVHKEQVVFCCSPVLSGVILQGKEVEEQACKIGFDASLCFFIDVYGCERVKTASLQSTILDGHWHHFAVSYTFHRSSGKSNLVFTVDGTSALNFEIPNNRSNKPGKIYPRQVCIGGTMQNNEIGFYGDLCNVRFWSTSKSPDRILPSLGRSAIVGNELELVLFLPLEEGQGNIVKDFAHSKSSSRKSEILTIRGTFTWKSFPEGDSNANSFQALLNNDRNISGPARIINNSICGDPAAEINQRIYDSLIRKFLISSEKYLHRKGKFACAAAGTSRFQTKLPTTGSFLSSEGSTFLLLRSAFFSLIRYKEASPHYNEDIFHNGAFTLMNLLESNIFALQFANNYESLSIDADVKVHLITALLYFFFEDPKCPDFKVLQNKAQKLLQTHLSFFFPDALGVLRLILLLLQLENKSGESVASATLRRAISNSKEDKSLFFFISPVSDLVPVILAMSKDGRSLLLEILCSQTAGQTSSYLNQIINSEVRPSKWIDVTKLTSTSKSPPDPQISKKPFVGAIVKRGVDWQYGNEDSESLGVILKVDKWNNEADKGIVVAWKNNGNIEKYRYGVVDFAGKPYYDLEIISGENDLDATEKKGPESAAAGERKQLMYTPADVFKALLNSQENGPISKRSVLNYIKEVAPQNWLESHDLLKPVNTLISKFQSVDVCNLYREFYSSFSSKAAITDKQSALLLANAFPASLIENKSALITEFMTEALRFISSFEDMGSTLANSVLNLAGSVQVLLCSDMEFNEENPRKIKIDFAEQDLHSELSSLRLQWDLTAGSLNSVENTEQLANADRLKSFQTVNSFTFGPSRSLQDNVQVRTRSRQVDLTLSGDREWSTILTNNGFEFESGTYKWYLRTKFSERRGHFLLGLATEDCNGEEFLGHDKNGWGISQNLDFFHGGKKQSLSTSGASSGEVMKISSGSILEVTYDSNRGLFGLVELLPDSIQVLVELGKCEFENPTKRKVYPAFSMFIHGDVISLITDMNEINACKMKLQFLQTSATSFVPSVKSCYGAMRIGTPNNLVIELSLLILKHLESTLTAESTGKTGDSAGTRKKIYFLGLHILGSLCGWTCPPLYKIEALKQAVTKNLDFIQNMLLSMASSSPLFSILQYLSSLMVLLISRIVEVQLQNHRFVSLHDAQSLKPGSVFTPPSLVRDWVSSKFFKNGHKASPVVESWIRSLQQKESKVEMFFRWVICVDRSLINVKKIGGEQMDKCVKLTMIAALYHCGLLHIANKLKDLLDEFVSNLGKLEGTLEEYFVKNMKPPVFLQIIWENATKLRSWAREESANKELTMDQVVQRIQERAPFPAKFTQHMEDSSLMFQSNDLMQCVNQCNLELKSIEPSIHEVTNGLKYFITDSLPIEYVDRYAKLISNAAMDRTAGFRQVQLLLGNLGNGFGQVTKTVFLDTVIPLLQGTELNWISGQPLNLLKNGNNTDWHYSNDLSGTATVVRNELKASFHSLFSLFVSELSTSSEVDYYKLALLNALSVRIEEFDHELLVRVNFFATLKDQLDEYLNMESKSDIAEKIILMMMKLLILMASQIAASNVDANELPASASFNLKGSNIQLHKVASGLSTLSDAVFDTLYKLLKEWGLKKHDSSVSSPDASSKKEQDAATAAFKTKIQTISTESANLLQCISRNEKCQRILCRKEWLDLLLELIFFSDPVCRLRCVFILSDCLNSIEPSQVRIISFGCIDRFPNLRSHPAFESLSPAETILQLLIFLIGNLLTEPHREVDMDGFSFFGIISEASALIRKLHRNSWKKLIERRLLQNFEQIQLERTEAETIWSYIFTGSLFLKCGSFEIPYLYCPVLVGGKASSFTLGYVKAINEENEKCEIVASKMKSFGQQMEMKSTPEEFETLQLPPDGLTYLQREPATQLQFSDALLVSLCKVWKRLSDQKVPQAQAPPTTNVEEKSEEILQESKVDEADNSLQAFRNSLHKFLALRCIVEILSSKATSYQQALLIMSSLDLHSLIKAAQTLTNAVNLSDIPIYGDYLAASIFRMLRPAPIITAEENKLSSPSPFSAGARSEKSERISSKHSSPKRAIPPSSSRRESEESQQETMDVDPGLIDSLAAMGFPRKVCAVALQVCGGDPAEALNYILSNGNSIVEMLAASENENAMEEQEAEEEVPGEEENEMENEIQQVLEQNESENEWILSTEEKAVENIEPKQEAQPEAQPEPEPEPDEEEEESEEKINGETPTCYHFIGSAKKFLPFHIEPNFQSERLGCVFPGDDLGVLEERTDAENQNVWYKVAFSDFDGNNYASTYGDEIYDIFVWVPKFVDGVEMVKSGPYNGDADNEMVDTPEAEMFRIDRYYRIIGSNGALLRDGQEITSNEVSSLNAGDIVHASEETFNSEGTNRLKLDSPVRGWISKIFGLVERIPNESKEGMLLKAAEAEKASKTINGDVLSTETAQPTLAVPPSPPSEMDKLDKIEDNIEVLSGYDIFARDDRFFGNRQGLEYKFFSSEEVKSDQNNIQQRSRISGSKNVFQYFKPNSTSSWNEIQLCMDRLIALYSRQALLSFICRVSSSTEKLQAFVHQLESSPEFSLDLFFRFIRLSVFRGNVVLGLEFLSGESLLQDLQIPHHQSVESCVGNFIFKNLTAAKIKDPKRETFFSLLLNSVAKNLTDACDPRYADHSWTDSVFDEDTDEDVFVLPNVHYALWASAILMRTGDVPTLKKLVYIYTRSLRGSSMSLKMLVFRFLADISCKLRENNSLNCDEMLTYYNEIIPIRRLSRFASKRLWQEFEDYPAFSRFIQSFISFIAETEVTLRKWKTLLNGPQGMPKLISRQHSYQSNSHQVLRLDKPDSCIQLFPAKDITSSWTLEMTLQRKKFISKHFTSTNQPYEKDAGSSRVGAESKLGGEKPALSKLLKLLLGTGGKSPTAVSEKKEIESTAQKSEKSPPPPSPDTPKNYLFPVYLLSSSKSFIKIQKGGRLFSNDLLKDPLHETEPVHPDACCISYGNIGGEERVFDYVFPFDEWATMHLVCDASATSMNLYFNGKLVDSQYGTIALPVATIGSTKTEVSFAGDLRSFKVWGYAKTTKEIEQQNNDNSSLINLKFDGGLNFGIYDARGYLATCKPRSCSTTDAPDLPVLTPTKPTKLLPFQTADELESEVSGAIAFQAFGATGQFVKGTREIVSLKYKIVDQMIVGILNWVEKNVQNYFIGEIKGNQQIEITLSGDDYYSGPPENLNWLKKLKVTGTINDQNCFEGVCSGLVLSEPSFNLLIGSMKVDKKRLSSEVSCSEPSKKHECTLELKKSAPEGQYIATFEVIPNPQPLTSSPETGGGNGKFVDLTRYGILPMQGSYWADFTIKANAGNVSLGFCTHDALTHPDASVDANDGAWTYSTSGTASHGANLHECDGSEETGTIISLQINTELGIIRFYRNYEILVVFDGVNGDSMLTAATDDKDHGIRPFVGLTNPGDSVTYTGIKEGPVKITFPANDAEGRNKLYTSVGKGSWKGYSLLVKNNEGEKWFGLWLNDLPTGLHVSIADTTEAEVNFIGAGTFVSGQFTAVVLEEVNANELSQLKAEYNRFRQRHADLKFVSPVKVEPQTAVNTAATTAIPTTTSPLPDVPTASSEHTPPPPIPAETVTINFVDASSESSIYHVAKDRPFGELFNNYARKRDASPKSFNFKYNGNNIEESATFLSLHLSENAVVEVSTKSFICPIVEFGDPVETYFPLSDAPYVILIVYEAGATVRNGIEIEESLALRTLKQGELLEAYKKTVTTEGIGRFKIADGWVSEKLRGGSEAPVSLTIRERYDTPKKYRVIRSDGAKIRDSASLRSTEIGICPIDTILTVTERKLVQSIDADSPYTARLRISEPLEWKGWISDKTHLLEEIKDNVDPDIAIELRRRNKIRQTRQLKKQSYNDLKTENLYAWISGNLSLSKDNFFLLRRSKNADGISFSDDFLTITSPDSSGGRALVLGSRGFSHGVHYWEVQVNNASWGSVFIGVAPEDTGGWNGFGFINYRAVQSFGSETLYGSYFGVGDKIGVLLDMDRGTLSFFKDGEDFNVGRVTVINMGVAYHNIRKLSNRYSSSSVLYPCFGMKNAGDQLTINNSHWISQEGMNATNFLEKLIYYWEFLTKWKLSYSQPETFLQYISTVHNSANDDEENRFDEYSSEKCSSLSSSSCISKELFKQYQEKVTENEFYIESRPGIPVKVASNIEKFQALLSEEFVKEYNIFAGVIMNTVYGKGMILGISENRIWYSCERNYKKAWYWLGTEFKDMLMTGRMTISYLDPTTIEFQTIPMLSKPSLSTQADGQETKKSDEETAQAKEYSELLQLSKDRFEETLFSFYKSLSNEKKWTLEDDIMLMKFITQVSWSLDVASQYLSIHNILYFCFSSTDNFGNKYTALFQKYSLKELILRYLLLNYFNFSMMTILPMIDLSASSEGLTNLSSVKSSLLSSSSTEGSSSPFSIASNMKDLISELKSIIYPSIKFDFWQSTVVETTVPTSAPPDEYERPEEIREVSINRIQARDAVRRKDSLSFAEKLKLSVFGQLMDNFNSWDSRSFRRSYIHMQDAGQPRAFFVKFIGEGVDDQGGPYRAIFQTSIGEELTENLLSVLVECANAKDEIGENRDKYQLNNGALDLVNPSSVATSPTATLASPEKMKLFIHLGKLIGIACRHKILLPLPLIPSIWKSLVNDSIDSRDLFAIERGLMNSLQQIPNYLKEDPSSPLALPAEQIYELLIQALLNCNTSEELMISPLKAKELVFSAMKRDGLELPSFGGLSLSDEEEIISTKSSNPSNKATTSFGEEEKSYGIQEIIELIQYFRLSSQNSLLQYFFEGLSYVLPVEVFTLFTPEELERLICGETTVDLEILKKATEYEGSITANDPHIQFFWQSLELLNSEEKSQFINFCSGRSRLPTSASEFPMPFKLTAPPANSVKNPDDYLPIARTCFFSLSLPKYSSLEVCLSKLKYAIGNTELMDADFIDRRGTSGWENIR